MSERVMIVDDSGLARSIIKDALSKGGFNVVGEASGGRQAVELLDSLKPDLAIIDFSMPDIDGEETSRLILAKNPSMKVVILSSLTEPMMKEDLLKLGVKAVLTKPFKTEPFLKTIKSIVRES
jgi:two-component system, chemotaxis family, chemotaxis protein CheY